MTPEASKPVRVLLVDDHALFRETLARALQAEPEFYMEHCASLREALQAVSRKPFDLVLLDHDLGDERGSQFLPAARELGFEGRVLIVTAGVSGAEARRLSRQGVAGIFLKHEPFRELVASMRVVAGGGTWRVGSLAGIDQAPASSGRSSEPVFTERQLAVLRLVVEGLSNKEIAWRLHISESYVKAILQELFHKTGVRTRGQLVRVAFEQYEDQV
jgi:DNA-binding NarL/FixJ family response regulator